MCFLKKKLEWSIESLYLSREQELLLELLFPEIVILLLHFKKEKNLASSVFTSLPEHLATIAMRPLSGTEIHNLTIISGYMPSLRKKQPDILPALCYLKA
jgi:hypothetical protein